MNIKKGRIKEDKDGCLKVDIEQGGGNVLTGSGLTIKKDKINDFKKALLLGEDFKCTYNSEEHTVAVTISDNYALFNYPGTVSYAIKLDDIKKHFILG